MSITRTNNNPASDRFRFLFILLALFAGSTGVTFALRGTARASEEAPAKSQPAAAASFPRMPADTEEKLANALNPQRIIIPSVFFEPFIDRLERVSQSIAQQTPKVVKAAEAPQLPPTPDFTTRYRMWQSKVQSARAARMPAPPVSQVYLLNELEPVGRRSARGQQSVLLFIKPEQRVFAAPFGTDFYDATLEGVDDRGVLFRTATGLRTLDWSTTNVGPLQQSNTSDREKKAQPESKPARPVAGSMDPVYANAATTTRPRRVTQPDPPAEQTASARPKQKSNTSGNVLQVLQEAVRNRHTVIATPAAPNSQEQRRSTTNVKQRGKPSRQQPNYVARGAISANITPSVGVKGVRFYNDQYEQGGLDVSAAPLLYYHPPRRDAFINTAYSTASYSTPSFRTVAWRNAQDEKRPRRATPDAGSTDKDPKGRDNRKSNNAGDNTSKSTPGVVVYPPNTTPSKEPTASEGGKQDSLSGELPAKRARRATGGRDTTDSDSLAASDGKVRDAQPSATPREVITPSAAADPSAGVRGSFCDPRFEGELYDITITRSIPLIDIADDLHNKFGVNFFVDSEVQKTPVRISVEQAPWTSVLRTILALNDLDAVCLSGNIIQIAARTKMSKLKDDRDKSAPLIREVFKLRYLQPVSGGRLNLAGQLQGGQGTANIQTLEEAIRRILRAGNDQRADVTRVPGRSEFIVVGTAEQISQIRELIEQVDKPGYQVVIEALIYTVNDTKVKDIGPQISAIVGNTSQSTLGGITSLNSSRTGANNGGTGGAGNGTGTGGTGNSGPVGRNPGGVGGLGEGFSQPGNGLQVPNPTAVLGITTIVGTAQFSAQLSLALKKSIANIQARPFGTVENGNQLNLVAGTTIPVLTNTIVAGGLAPTGSVQFIEASRVLRITPQVAEDANGNPNYVTLEIQIENNSIDPSKGTFGSLPVLERQSLQTTLRLQAGETGVIGGLALNSVARATSSIPLLGSVPIFGRMFRREFDQIDKGKLYFAVTAKVVKQGAPLPNPPVPSDAVTDQPPPPAPQRPGPYEKKP